MEVRAEAHAEFALAQDGPLHVALDLQLDDDPLAGPGPRAVRALNDHRKASGYEIADRIRVQLYADGALAEAADRHRASITADVLAISLELAPASEAPLSAAVVDIDGATCQVASDRVHPS